jgi:hypothetical protein
MAGKKIFKLVHEQARQRAMQAIQEADDGWVVEVSPPRRSLDQNKLLWSRLDQISDGVIWHGQKLTAEDWKHVLSASLHRQRAIPGTDGGFVVLGQATSKMTSTDFSDLIALAEAFAIEQGVQLKAPQDY